MKKITFPSYEQVVQMNDTTKYKGWQFEQHITENLYLSIEALNENVVLNIGEPVLCFKWCTHNGFPIAIVRYKNCADGYYSGIKYLLDTAEEFSKVFSEFLTTTKITD